MWTTTCALAAGTTAIAAVAANAARSDFKLFICESPFLKSVGAW
jgi:hypothetical protein